ncbi:MAG: branched-chain amino acid ABC transporter permease [Acidimicrobiales bacterium]
MEYFLQVLVNGLMVGGVYALVAVGYSVVYGLLGFINFAHGEVMTLGAYIFFTFHVLCGMGILASAIAAVLLAGIASAVVERVAYRPLRRSSRLSLLLSALAVSAIIQNTLGLVFGYGVLSVRKGVVFAPIRLGVVTISRVHLGILLVLTVLVICLVFFLRYLRTGVVLRATAESIELAEAAGINTDRVIAWTFFVAGALASLAGLTICMDQDLHPLMGFTLGIKAFTASVLGGVGNLIGAVYAGLLLGLGESLAAGWLPAGYKDALVYVILIGCLLVRPQGLFQKPTVRPY